MRAHFTREQHIPIQSYDSCSGHGVLFYLKGAFYYFVGCYECKKNIVLVRFALVKFCTGLHKGEVLQVSMSVCVSFFFSFTSYFVFFSFVRMRVHYFVMNLRLVVQMKAIRMLLMYLLLYKKYVKRWILNNWTTKRLNTKITSETTE